MMDILSISAEILQIILEIGEWITRKLTRQAEPESPPPTAKKLLERFLILFTKHSMVWLGFIVVGGLMFGLHLDARIGVFLIGVIFTLAGTGQLVILRKDMGEADMGESNCLHYILYAVSAFVLLSGVLISIGALSLVIAGISIDAPGR
jgi:hypothetical protein